MKMAEVVCLGLLVADVFASPLHSLPAAGELSLIERYLLGVGGCAANTAADLRRLGRHPSVLGKVGEDLFGDFVLQDLKRLGIDASAVRKSPSHPTSCTFILNVQGQDRRYVHCIGANADFALRDVDREALDGARALYVGGFLAMPAFRPEHLAELFREAKRRGLFTVLDVVIPAGTTPSLNEMREALAYTDAFLPNNDEARTLTGRSDPIEQAEVLASFVPDGTIVITQGGAGALARRGRRILRAGAFEVESIDESGSGDAFDAGFLVGMLEGWPWEDSLRFASAVGASCTRALGCHDGVFRFEEARTFTAQHHFEIEVIA
jgi:sugar/nucleoside kinase (ribokinase family)